MKRPRVVPSKSEQELIELRDAFYKGDKRRALSKAKALETRGNLPPAIEATSLLMSTILDDTPGKDSYAMRCAYSMALIRFVNGQLDQLQKSQTVIPLLTLAQNCGLPTFFVEMRHVATHEGLPSLEFLRESSETALDWLWNRYWNANSYEETSEVEDEQVKGQIKQLFRDWRRTRRVDTNKTFKPGDTSEAGIEYWKMIKSFEQFKEQDEELLFDVMYNLNVLVPTKGNVDAAIRLFGPLLDQMNKDEFVFRLAKYGLGLLNTVQIDQDLPKQYVHIMGWLKEFTQPKELQALRKGKPWMDTRKFAYCCLEKPRKWNLDLLQHINSQDKTVNKLTSDMEQQFVAPVHAPKRKLEEIDNEMKQYSKRLHKDETVNNNSGWQPVSNWSPRPIGVL